MKKHLLWGVACLLLSLNLYSQDFSYCYDSGETDVVAFEVCPSPGGTATASICQGSFEDTYDDLTVYEGATGSTTTGAVVLGPVDGDLTGTDIVASAPDLCLIFISNSDGSVSCANGAEDELQVYIAGCPACNQPATRPLAGATLTLGGACVDGNNTGTGEEANEPVGTCFSGGTQNSVWYQITGDGSDITVTTDFAGGTNGDTEVAVYTFADPASYCDVIQVACDQDGGTAENFNSTTTFSSVSGTSYFVQVSGYLGTTGSYQIQAFSTTSPRCEITSVSGVENGDCDPGTGPGDETYSATVTINTVNAVTSGNFNVNGQTFAANGSNPLVVILTGLSADGADVDLDVSYDLDPCCSGSAIGAFTAPTCSATCVVNSMSFSNLSSCTYDSGSGSSTYSVDITVLYSTPPAGGSLDVTIDGNTTSEAIGSSPQTISVSGLTADGLEKDVTAAFSMDAACTATEAALYTAPESCAPPANDLCENAIDLATLTSPLNATTEGANDDDLQTCAGGNTSPDIYYTIEVADGEVLTIGQTANGYDSENYIGYGGSCGEVNAIDCYDDPDTKTVTWLNCTGSTQTVVWVQDGYFSESNAGTFTLEWSLTPAPVPACIAANSPADAAIDVATSGNIDWSATDNACSYDVYLDTNSPPTTLLGNTSELSIPYSGLTNGTTYNLLIVPKNSSGEATGCTFSTFTTTATPPACTTITSPSDAAIDVSIEGSIIFAAATGADSYDVYLDQNTTPSTLLGNTTTTSIDYTGLDYEAIYYVQIVPKNAVGDAMGCPITGFTTEDSPPDCASGTVISCGESIDITLEGSGSWNGNPCYFSSPGDEVVYRFTATYDGVHSIVKTGGTGYIDYQWKLSDGATCDNTGWTCIDDITSNGTYEIGTLSAGDEIWLLLDSESTTARSHTFNVGCPPPPIANSGGVGFCQNATTAMVDGTGGKVNLLVAGDIIAAVSSTEDLGMVDASYLRYDATDNSLREYGAGDIPMIDRSIVITPTNQPTGTVSVFLYYTDAEYDEIIANSSATSWADMSVTKFDTDECSDMEDPNSMGGTLTTYVGATAVTGGWEVELEVSSFSGFQAAATSVALPIKLDRFTAKADGRHNMIEWTTATELNVQDHTIMKSDDAINWEVLGVTDGEVNSNSSLDYEMIDVFPLANTYYQLMTTDIDGSTSYSPVVNVTRGGDKTSAFLGASPVPTRDVVNLNVYSQTDDNMTITLTDISGKSILVETRPLSAGDHQLPLDMSNMTSGVYFVTITSDLISKTHRVIKN